MPSGSFLSLPGLCASCSDQRGTANNLYMYDPYDEMSDQQFYCKECWQKSGIPVPGKALLQWFSQRQWSQIYMHARRRSVAGSSRLSNVYITDFAFPSKASLVFQAKDALSSALQSHGANVHDGVDATASRESILSQLGLGQDEHISLVVWGSPHPHSFTEILPQDAITERSNAGYKSAAFDMLKSKWPSSCCVVVAPNYYGLPGAIPLKVPPQHEVQYWPMASSSSSYQRLCDENHIIALTNMPGLTSMVLRTLVQSIVKIGGKVIFFGEYICTLSFTCCIPNQHIGA